jgi:hypothetical protein
MGKVFFWALLFGINCYTALSYAAAGMLFGAIFSLILIAFCGQKLVDSFVNRGK